jgi:hypothetical protein
VTPCRAIDKTYRLDTAAVAREFLDDFITLPLTT